MENEKTELLACLDTQRAHVVGILEGLPSDALHRPVLPSGWTSLGLVQHLAVDVERFWFRRVVAADLLDPDSDDGWVVAPRTRPQSVFDGYRQEIDRANAIIAATALDAEPRAWPDFFGEWRLADLRAVILHVIAETACHAGHLDAVRELIDGRTWLTLT
ncbi:MAG TPA: DinB family protein [Acidimicrobiales bacterium]|nr:DinB family protein [Acidimicrobiales bacterium]